MLIASSLLSLICLLLVFASPLVKPADAYTCAPSHPPANPYGDSTVSSGWTKRMGWVLGEVNARFSVGLSGTAPGSGHITHHYGNSADAKPVGAAWGTVARGEAKAAGDCLAHWLAGNWRNLGIDYVIWYGRLFNPRKLSVNGGWRAYCNPRGCSGATRQHYDHVHIQVTGDPGRPRWW